MTHVWTVKRGENKHDPGSSRLVIISLLRLSHNRSDLEQQVALSAARNHARASSGVSTGSCAWRMDVAV